VNDDELESNLRRMLADPSRRLPDALVPLDHVYAGTGRRRARRNALAATSATAAAVLVVAGLGAWHVLGAQSPHPSGIAAGTVVSLQPTEASTPVGSSSPVPGQSNVPVIAPTPSSGPTQSSSAAVPAGFSPVSVTAISPNRWWVLGSDGLVAATTDGGDTFSVVTKSVGPGATMLRFANAADGWAVTASGLVATSNGGTTWSPVRLDGKVAAVEAGGGSVFAVTERASGTWGVSTAPVGANVWRSVGSLGTLVQPPLLAVQSGHAVVAAWDSTGFRSWLVAPSGPPVAYPAPCTPATGADDLSATTGSVWLVCIDGTADSLWRSTDATSWLPVPAPTPAGRMKVGATAPGHAAVGLQDGTVALTAGDGYSIAGKGSPVSGGWRYIAFTNRSDGFALSDSGVLMRSTDGGYHWVRVTFS
jgi:photosystem II stability/assembly factor-like uncharacterized protein